MDYIPGTGWTVAGRGFDPPGVWHQDHKLNPPWSPLQVAFFGRVDALAEFAQARARGTLPATC